LDHLVVPSSELFGPLARIPNSKGNPFSGGVKYTGVGKIGDFRRKSPFIATSSADADNGLDAFSGQSRSTNMVPFHILGIVSYCTIVSLSFRRALFTIFDFKKCRDLEIRVRGHSISLKVATFGRLSYLRDKISIQH